jgi:hypothetical protein
MRGIFLIDNIDTDVKRDACGCVDHNMRRHADAPITITMPEWLAYVQLFIIAWTP